MEAATPLPIMESRVSVLADRVRIELLEIVDATLAEIVRSRAEAGQPPEQTVRAATEIGARVLARESTAADVEFVQREFERVSGEVERAFAERATALSGELQKRFDEIFAEEGGAFGKALDGHVGELSELIAANFGADRTSAVQHQISERVHAILKESSQELLNQLSTEGGKNPLADFKQAIARSVSDASQTQEKRLSSLGEQLANLQVGLAHLQEQERSKEALAEAEERGTAKGRTFEEQIYAAVERIAEARGDASFHVGDERAASGGKLGDVVVEIGAAHEEAAARLVFEAKTERLSKNKAWEVLNGSMAERDADYGVLVVPSEETVPAGRELFHEYEGNKLIVAADPESDLRALELAYRYVRSRCLMMRDRSLRLDAAAVRDAAGEAASALKEAQKIRSALTGAGKNVDQARAALDAMVERISAQLDRVEALIEAG